jgi:RNA polymerase sigma-70 factor (ECF subfamily)
VPDRYLGDGRLQTGEDAAPDADRALAALAAAGDAEAFTKLVRRHERRVRSFLTRLCRGSGADDLAQDTFLQAWRMAASFRGEGSYEGWLLRIAWRQFLSGRRTRQREVDTLPEETRDTAQHDTGQGIDLERALAMLDARERAAALLCFSQGYSHGEAAAILEMPLGTLKSVVARARTRLAAYLEGAET